MTPAATPSKKKTVTLLANAETVVDDVLSSDSELSPKNSLFPAEEAVSLEPSSGPVVATFDEDSSGESDGSQPDTNSGAPLGASVFDIDPTTL